MRSAPLDCRAAVLNFLEDEGTKRLLVYVDGKDLGAVSYCHQSGLHPRIT